MLAEKSLSWSSTTHWSHFSTTTQVLWMLDTQAKSEHSQAYVVSPLKIAKEVVTHQHEKISTASTLKAELFYTWLCKPSMLRSSRLARMSPPKHTLYLSYKGAYGPAILPGNSLIQVHASWLSKKQAVRKSYLRSACGQRLLC